jgi:membrane-associated protease RseP (regulator of RpoE activity)
MSNVYRKFREQMAAGGDTQDLKEESGNRGSSVSLVAVLAFVVWLAMRNPWTLVFVVGLIVSIFLHEFGHYWTARKTGMKVTQFYMGFGPRLWSRKRGELEYGVRAFPLGAFVRIVGMSNLDDCDPADEDRSYRSKSYPRRLLVITAGSLMHMVIALTLFVGVYAAAGRLGETGSVRIVYPPISGSPAAQIGLREGDVITSINGEVLKSREDLVTAITSNAPGEQIAIAINRLGEQQTLEATLAANPVDETLGYLGVGTESVDYIKQSLPSAVVYAVRDSAQAIVGSVQALPKIFNPANAFNSLRDSTADPSTRPSTIVGASQVGGEAGERDGLKGVLLMLAYVNVFVGVFNMFPSLPFDGGHAAVATYERLRSRKGVRYRADFGKMIPLATAVVALLIVITFAGLYLDISQPFG